MALSAISHNPAHTESAQGTALDYLISLVNQSKYELAIEYLARLNISSLKTAREWDLLILEAFVRLMVYQGYHKKALPLIIRSLNRANQIQNSSIMAQLLYWQGIVSLALKKPYQEFFDQAFEITNKNDECNLNIKNQAILGMSLLDESIENREKILLHALKIANNTMEENPTQRYQYAHILNSLGIYYGLLRDERSIYYFEKVIILAKKIGDKRRLGGSLINHANLNFLSYSNPELNLIGKGMLQEATKLCEEIEALEYAALGHRSLVEYYQHKGRREQALIHLTSLASIELKRELLNTEQIKQITELLIINNH